MSEFQVRKRKNEALSQQSGLSRSFFVVNLICIQRTHRSTSEAELQPCQTIYICLVDVLMKTTEHIGKISLDNKKRTNLVQNYFLVLRSYQVEHKAGVLSIMATKDKADVDVKSDTIRLLVKPGDRQVPAAKVPEVKTVHVEANLPRIYAL